jgi:flagellar protein FlbD
MIKLTRLNNHVVAINPDHIGWADATPDTTLCLLGGEKILVRESLEELIDAVVRFRRLVRAPSADEPGVPNDEGDPPRALPSRRPVSEYPRRVTSVPPAGVSREGR